MALGQSPAPAPGPPRESPGVELHIRPPSICALLLERLLMEGELTRSSPTAPSNTRCWPAAWPSASACCGSLPADLPAPTPEDPASPEPYVFGHTCHYRRQVDRWLAESGIQPRATLEIESYPMKRRTKNAW